MAQKKLPNSLEAKRRLIEPDHPDLSVRRQCELLGVNRFSYYYVPASESPLNLAFMQRIDEICTASPFYGYRKITVLLQREGHAINRKQVAWLMNLMSIHAICPGPQTSRPAPDHKVYPIGDKLSDFGNCQVHLLDQR